MRDTLISIHMPKTAGQSFLKTLTDYFGEGVIEDYGDHPINTPPMQRNTDAVQNSLAITSKGGLHGAHCIHGHFLPVKYLLASAGQTHVKFITWFRDPVDRLISNYFYWTERIGDTAANPLQQRVVEEGWSLEAFCFSPELQNMYEQFLWGFPVRYLDFVGITEHYEADLAYFTKRFLDNNSLMYKENARGVAGSRYDVSQAFRQEVEEFHAKDVSLYRRACKARLNRS